MPGFPAAQKNSAVMRRLGFNPWVGKTPWGKEWQFTPVFLLGESHGQRSLAGCSPWGRKSLSRLSQLNNNNLSGNVQRSKRSNNE